MWHCSDAEGQCLLLNVVASFIHRYVGYSLETWGKELTKAQRGYIPRVAMLERQFWNFWSPVDNEVAGQ